MSSSICVHIFVFFELGEDVSGCSALSSMTGFISVKQVRIRSDVHRRLPYPLGHSLFLSNT